MTKLSVNINKFATLRNARGGNNPNVVQVAIDCERFGAEGITVHPRPDERHITYQDVINLKKVVTTEFNIEGYPDERYLRIIEEVRPDQATLVPDKPDVLTSNAGWDVMSNQRELKQLVTQIKKYAGRVSLFVDPVVTQVEAVQATGADRIELYTEPYASAYGNDPVAAVKNYIDAAQMAANLNIGVNAGHDLDLHNLHFLKNSLPTLAEVSIGHALVCDALYLGLEKTIEAYLLALK